MKIVKKYIREDAEINTKIKNKRNFKNEKM